MKSNNLKLLGIDNGVRDEKGHWRPTNPIEFVPIFAWPIRPLKFIKWLFGYSGYIWPVNMGYLILAFITLTFLQPEISKCTNLEFSWIALMLLRNLVLVWIIYGGYHLVLYKWKLHGNDRKYHPNGQSENDKRFLFNNQVLDNVFRSCVYGVPIWTAYEVLYIWAAANEKVPYLNWSEHPIWFVFMFLLIPIWRDTHFYFIHRLIHWKPLMKTVHSVHHKNPNPGPWAGLAMHPIEHFIYFSALAIHFVVPSHPLHFFFNSQPRALKPAGGHHGFEGPLFNGKLVTGSYFHYLHHKHVVCNFGERSVPLDKWFGSFYNGIDAFKPISRQNKK